MPNRLLHKRVPVHKTLVMKHSDIQDPAALSGKLTAGSGLPIGGHGPYASDAVSAATKLRAHILQTVSDSSIGGANKPRSGHHMLHIPLETCMSEVFQ